MAIADWPDVPDVIKSSDKPGGSCISCTKSKDERIYSMGISMD